MEQGVEYCPCLSLRMSAVLRSDGWCLEHPPELLGRSTRSWFSALLQVRAVMVQLGDRTRWALDFPSYPKRHSKPHGKKPGMVLPGAQPFNAAQGEGIMTTEHRQAATTQRGLAEGTGYVSPGRWWGQRRSQGVLTHAATPASLPQHLEMAGKLCREGNTQGGWEKSCSNLLLVSRE